MQQEVQLRQQERQRFSLAPEEAIVLQDSVLLDRICLALKVQVGFGQEPACAAGWIEDGLTEFRVRHLDHEAHNRSGRIELARIPRGVAHLAQQRLVEAAEGVNFF